MAINILIVVLFVFLVLMVYADYRQDVKDGKLRGWKNVKRD